MPRPYRGTGFGVRRGRGGPGVGANDDSPLRGIGVGWAARPAGHIHAFMLLRIYACTLLPIYASTVRLRPGHRGS